jgi:nicotinamidase-related amidase
MMLEADHTMLVVVDIQDRLANVMHEKELLFENARKLVKGIRVLNVPVLWVEQNPQGLGPTIPEVAELLSDVQPISKVCFNCCRNDHFLEALHALDRRQILIAGIETHVCVYQTAVDLADRGHEVQVVTDAVSSRDVRNKELGLEKMRDSGVGWTSVETALFEMLKVAEGPQFKEMLAIVK